MAEQRKPKQHAFELCRATAVMMVVFAHYFSASKDLPVEVKSLFSAFTYLGVPLFFIISGYLLAASLMSLLRSGSTVSRAVTTFFLKRIYRIYPAYLVSLVVLSVLVGAGWPDFFAHLFNVHNLFAGYNRSINAVYWTLAVEFQWYLFAPLLIVFFIRSSIALSLLVLAAMIGVSFVVRLFVLGQYSDDLIGVSELERLAQDQLSVHLFNFCLGITIYKIREVEFFGGRWLVVILIAMLLYLGYEISGIMQAAVQREGEAVTYKLTLLYLSILLLGLTVHSILRVALSAIIYRIVSFISAISYSLYIYHFPIVEYLKTFHFSWGVLLVLYIPASVAVASVSYFLIEAPFLRYSARMGKPPRQAEIR